MGRVRATRIIVTALFCIAFLLLFASERGGSLTRRSNPEGEPPTLKGLPGEVQSLVIQDIPSQWTKNEVFTPKMRIYTPYSPIGAPSYPIVFVVGGTWTRGSIASRDELILQLASLSKYSFVFVNVEFRLAPAFAFPTALSDIMSAVEWVSGNARQLGGDTKRLTLLGIGAGANLATAAIMVLTGERRQLLEPSLKSAKPCAQILVTPILDASMSLPSHEAYAEGPGSLTLSSLRSQWAAYLSHSVEKFFPLANPSVASTNDVRNSPPTLVMAAELDTVRDEGEAYAEKLRDAGVDVTSKLFPGQEHEFFTKHEDDDGFREQAQAMAIAFLEEKCKSPSILTQEEGL